MLLCGFHWHFRYISPTLLLLDLPWLTETGDFLSRGDNSFVVLVCALGLQFERERAYYRGQQLAASTCCYAIDVRASTREAKGMKSIDTKSPCS